MNKTKLIGIEIPVMANLAKLALFGEILKMFNLHPGKIAEHLIETAKREHCEPAAVAENIIPMSQEVFHGRLSEAQALLSKGRTAKALMEAPLTKYFNLDPEKVAKLITNRIEQAGMDPMEIVDGRWTQGEIVVVFLRGVVREIIPWAFHEAVRIVKLQTLFREEVQILESQKSK